MGVRFAEMLHYPNGREIQIGDSVTIMHGLVEGTVESIVVTEEQINDMGVDEPGIMLVTLKLGGRAYFAASCFQHEKLGFVASKRKPNKSSQPTP